MTKSELIEQIRSINRGATREFLTEFTERELNDYVRQLSMTGAPRVDYDPPGVGPATARLAV
ncbi:MAG: hypothetical protein HOP29_00655 [Phycisphaerales bacterium]|nr:hypothetical protein [Phycisphaerales bacterium]